MVSVVSKVDSPMMTSTEVPRWRKWAASGSLVPLVAWLIGQIEWVRLDLPLLGLIGLLAATAFGLSRRSVRVQVFSRGVTWLLCGPSVLAALFMLIGGHHIDASVLGVALASSAALLLARPALHTKEALAAFGPVAYRRVFLAGAVASVTAATLIGIMCFDNGGWGHVARGVAEAGVTLGLLASAVGVLRMRAWGVLLGGLTSAAALVAAAVLGSGDAILLALAAVPGLILLLPVLHSRVARDRNKTAAIAVPTRVMTAPLLRVAPAEDAASDEAVEEEASAPPPRVALRVHGG
jgi:hypothetical protein